VRRLCPRCRKAYPADAQEAKLLKLGNNDTAPVIYRAAGCERCNYLGYKGRIAIMELLRLTPELDYLIAKRSPVRDIRIAAIEGGFRELADDGLRRVLDGSTSIEEVARVVDLTGRM
jgi:type IV pilus assembly protein PilB